MSGIIIIDNVYQYEGTILNDLPHGIGIFKYNNGDTYTGECQFGKIDGFGIYLYADKKKYTGYFSYDKFNGIGTYEDGEIITKGSWRYNKKHGNFIITHIRTYKTIQQLWLRGILKTEKEINYIRPLSLITTKQNPAKNKKTTQVLYRYTEHSCIGCSKLPKSACNINCGHVCMCYECLSKCETCPICRCPNEKIIQLYLN